MNTKLILAFCLSALLAAPLLAQGNGVTLLSHQDDYTQYNDIWGYTAPNGDEYAIIGTTTGTAIYNCVDPTSPYLTGFISGPTSTWRDMKTYDQYAYVVTEGGGGVQIIDLGNPEAPSLLTTWGAGLWGNTHNVYIETATGTGYACGTNNGTMIFDLSADPTAPTLTGSYTSHYVHDLYVAHGMAHLAAINNGFYRIIDANSQGVLDQVTTPGSFTHSVWVNDADTVAATTDESSQGRLTLYDVSDPGNIQFLSAITIDPNSTIHNAFIKGDRVYASWYTAGFGCIDISDPSNPTVLGSYDTSASSGPGYAGAWGCYPFAPSGNVYVSDLQEGLFILQVDGPLMNIAHTPLGDTQNEFDGYPVAVNVTHLQGGTVTGAQVHYALSGGGGATVAMSNTGGNQWSATIPGQPSPEIVSYHVEAFDDDAEEQRLPSSGDFTFLVGAQNPVYTNGFEGVGDEGWTHAQIATQDDWQRGTPQGASGNSGGVPWSDPAAAYSGSKCWSNDLGASGWNGSYAANVSNWLESPAVDCSGAGFVTLRFQRWLTVQDEEHDQAILKVNGTEIWRNATANLHPGEGTHELDTTWNLRSYDISALAADNPSVVVRFELMSDESIELGGWNIDDFEILSLDPVGGVDQIALTGDTTGFAGNTVSYDLGSAPPDSPWLLYASKKMQGVVIDGHDFEIGPGIKTIAGGTTNMAGQASWTSTPIPGRFAGRRIRLEARADWMGKIYDSNKLTLDIF